MAERSHRQTGDGNAKTVSILPESIWNGARFQFMMLLAAAHAGRIEGDTDEALEEEVAHP